MRSRLSRRCVPWSRPVRLLLDECVPKQFAAALVPLQCDHLTAVGWSGIKNGELLRRMADAGFAVLVTTDRNLVFQQPIVSSRVVVAVLTARTNRLADLLPLAGPLRRVLPLASPGQVLVVRLP